MTARTLLIAGEPLPIEPVRLGQLGAFVRAVQPIAADLVKGEVDVLALLAEHSERVLAALAAATGKPHAWVAALPLDDAVALAAEVIKVNADFFVRRVLPAMTTQLGEAIAPIQSATSTTGSSNSPPAASLTTPR